MERRINLYQSHPWFFAIDCANTFDEETGEWRRFPRYDYLKTVFDRIATPEDKYWPKSQRMLITISFCIHYLCGFLFEDGFNGFMTSKGQDAVDNIKAGWNSLFGKIRAIFDQMPNEVVEIALGRRYHSSELFNYMAATNPVNGNVIVGHAPTPACGTGEGYTIAFVDECAAVYNMNVIHTNLTQSCRTNKNYVGFPLGRNNKFADIHFHPTHYGFKKIEISWNMNPRYTKEWYNKLSKKMTKFQIAQRLDRSFEESTQGKVWNKFNLAKNVKPTEHIEGLPVYLWWDFGVRDPTSVGFVQYLKPTIRVFDWYENNETNYRDISGDLRAMLTGYGIRFVEDGKDSEGFSKWKLDLGHLESYGDPQVKAAELSSGRNLQTAYSEQGFDIVACDPHNTIMALDKIDDKFEADEIRIDPRCEPFIESCQYWEWPCDSKGNPKPGATQPAHTRHSHAGKAFEYGFVMTVMSEVDYEDVFESMVTSGEKKIYEDVY